MNDVPNSTTDRSGSNGLAVPAEFEKIAAICMATEVVIGGRTVIGIADARDLHAGLGVGRDYSTWMGDIIKKYGFVNEVDFEPFDGLSSPVSGSPKSRSQKTKEYRLTLTMAKELAMVENNDVGRLARRYFIWAEEKARRLLAAQSRPADPIAALNDPSVMRGLLLTYSEKVLALQDENASLTPKAEALDRIANADAGALSITAAAKALQARPKDLFDFLRMNGWIYKRAGGAAYLGYQSKTTAGLLEHKVTTVLRADGSEKVVEQVLVTPKGLTRLAVLMKPLTLTA